MQPRYQATVRQPLQCVWQHHVANLHVSSLRTWQHDDTTIMQPFHCDMQPQIQDTHTNTHRNNHSLQNTEGNTFADETTGAATAAHTRYLSSPPAATLRGKTYGSVRRRLPPQHKAHATFMQPLQCFSQHHVANLHVSMHMATPDDNNHAAIPLRYATSDSRHAYTNTRRNNHSLQNTEGNTFADETTGAATAAQRRYLSSPAEDTLKIYTKKHKVSWFGFSPTQGPCNMHAAITMRLAASRRKPARIYAHGRTRWQQSCSHSIAICNHRFKTRIELRTTTTTRCRTQRRNTFADETTAAATAARRRYIPFIAGRSHFTRKNTRFCAPASSPTHSPCNIHAPITMRFAASRCKPAHIYAHDQMTAIMQPFQCDLQPQIQDTHRTTHRGPTTRCRTQRRNTFGDETTAAATAAHRRYLSSPAEGTLH